MNSISDICYEQIQDNYWYGSYGEFKMVMMKDCGYVNATKLCKDGGKRFDNWLANSASKRLLKALDEQLGHEAPDFIPVESSLTGKDPAPGFPGAVCKYIQTANISDVGR